MAPAATNRQPITVTESGRLFIVCRLCGLFCKEPWVRNSAETKFHETSNFSISGTLRSPDQLVFGARDLVTNSEGVAGSIRLLISVRHSLLLQL